MKIPNRIEPKLREDSEFHAAVLALVTQVESWLDAVPMVFLPEFTRHDNLHNEEILAAASDLLPRDSLELLSQLDAAVLG